MFFFFRKVSSDIDEELYYPDLWM